MRATMSLIGLYNFNDSLFSQLNLPEGIDSNVVINNILYECAELEVLYPNPNILKHAIGVWSTKQLPVWTHLYETMQYEYNPLNNYGISGSEVSNGTSSGNNTSTVTNNLTNTRTDNLSEVHSGVDSGSSSESGTSSEVIDDDSLNIHKESSFDSDTLRDSNSDTYTDDKTTTTTYESEGLTSLTHGENIANTGTVTNTNTGTQATVNESEGESSNTTTTNRSGSTGVYTPQMMIEQERELAKFNIIDYIIKDFKNRFCLLVY